MQKCMICGKKYDKADDLFLHVECDHNDQIPNGWTGSRYVFNYKHGRSTGKCRICSKDTDWNESTKRPFMLCKNPNCKKVYREGFKNNMIRRYGKEHLLNDPDVQKKMLANRAISGEYVWSDRTLKTYTGSYEKDFLQFADIFLNFDSADVFTPAPQVFEYEYNGEKKFYMPDVFIGSINAVLEIKDGGDNPNTHGKIMAVDKEKERLKDEVMKNQSEYNYIKIVNKQYGPFLDFLAQIKEDRIKFKNEKTRPIIIINEQVDLLLENMIDMQSTIYIISFEDDVTGKDRIGIVTNDEFDKVYIMNELKVEKMDGDHINGIVGIDKVCSDFDSSTLLKSIEENNADSIIKLLSSINIDVDSNGYITDLTTLITNEFIENVTVTEKYGDFSLENTIKDRVMSRFDIEVDEIMGLDNNDIVDNNLSEGTTLIPEEYEPSLDIERINAMIHSSAIGYSVRTELRRILNYCKGKLTMKQGEIILSMISIIDAPDTIKDAISECIHTILGIDYVPIKN